MGGYASLSSSKGRVTSMSTATGTYKLATLRRDGTVSQKILPMNSSNSNSPRSEVATVWKRSDDRPITSSISSPSLSASTPSVQNSLANKNITDSSSSPLNLTASGSSPASEEPKQASSDNTDSNSNKTNADEKASESTNQQTSQKSVTFDSASKTEAPAKPETSNNTDPTEEELLKQGIHLARRLSTEASQKIFNWDEDEDDFDYSSWSNFVNNPFFTSFMDESKNKASSSTNAGNNSSNSESSGTKKIDNKPSLSSTSATSNQQLNSTTGHMGWKIPQTPQHIVPISEQIQELTENRNNQSRIRNNQQYNEHHDSTDFWNGNRGSHHSRNIDHQYHSSLPHSQQQIHSDDRYKYSDYDRRYRSEQPTHKAELFNEHNKQVESYEHRRRGSGSMGRYNTSVSPRRYNSYRSSHNNNHSPTSGVDNVALETYERRHIAFGTNSNDSKSRQQPLPTNQNQANDQGGVNGSSYPYYRNQRDGSPNRRYSSSSNVRNNSVSPPQQYQQIQPVKRSRIEQQEEIMRLARETALKRKEEEARLEKEREEMIKKKAEERLAKLAAATQKDQPNDNKQSTDDSTLQAKSNPQQKGERGDSITTKTGSDVTSNNSSNSNESASNFNSKQRLSDNGDGSNKKMEAKDPRNNHPNARNPLWGSASSTISASEGDLWGIFPQNGTTAISSDNREFNQHNHATSPMSPANRLSSWNLGSSTSPDHAYEPRHHPFFGVKPEGHTRIFSEQSSSSTLNGSNSSSLSSNTTWNSNATHHSSRSVSLPNSPLTSIHPSSQHSVSENPSASSSSTKLAIRPSPLHDTPTMSRGFSRFFPSVVNEDKEVKKSDQSQSVASQRQLQASPSPIVPGVSSSSSKFVVPMHENPPIVRQSNKASHNIPPRIFQNKSAQNQGSPHILIKKAQVPNVSKDISSQKLHPESQRAYNNGIYPLRLYTRSSIEPPLSEQIIPETPKVSLPYSNNVVNILPYESFKEQELFSQDDQSDIKISVPVVQKPELKQDTLERSKAPSLNSIEALQLTIAQKLNNTDALKMKRHQSTHVSVLDGIDILNLPIPYAPITVSQKSPAFLSSNKYSLNGFNSVFAPQVDATSNKTANKENIAPLEYPILPRPYYEDSKEVLSLLLADESDAEEVEEEAKTTLSQSKPASFADAVKFSIEAENKKREKEAEKNKKLSALTDFIASKDSYLKTQSRLWIAEKLLERYHSRDAKNNITSKITVPITSDKSTSDGKELSTAAETAFNDPSVVLIPRDKDLSTLFHWSDENQTAYNREFKPRLNYRVAILIPGKEKAMTTLRPMSKPGSAGSTTSSTYTGDASSAAGDFPITLFSSAPMSFDELRHNIKLAGKEIDENGFRFEKQDKTVVVISPSKDAVNTNNTGSSSSGNIRGKTYSSSSSLGSNSHAPSTQSMSYGHHNHHPYHSNSDSSSDWRTNKPRKFINDNNNNLRTNNSLLKSTRPTASLSSPSSIKPNSFPRKQ